MAEPLLSSWLDIVPKSKGRPRVEVLPNGKRMTRNPEATQVYEDALSWLIRAACPAPHPLVPEADVAVMATFYLPTRRRIDVDNMGKALLDAATGILWADDSQVAHLSLSRYLPGHYSAADNILRVGIHLSVSLAPVACHVTRQS